MYTWFTVGDGKYQASRQCICPTVGPRFVPQHSEKAVNCLQPESDSILHVSICCKLLASQTLLKGSKEMDISGCKIKALGRTVHNLPAVVTASHKSSSHDHGDVLAKQPGPFAINGLPRPVKCTTITSSSYIFTTGTEIPEMHIFMDPNSSSNDFPC